MTALVIILVCVFLLFHTYIFYPTILVMFAKLFKRQNRQNDIEKQYLDLTIVISAYNEERLIRDCIDSIFASDYPQEMIKVIVGSDGSNDNTVAILDELSKKYTNMAYYDLERSGKNGVLNKIVPDAQTDIICFMDADCRTGKNTLERLIANFQDSTVGAAIAKMESVGDDIDNAGGKGEALYQQYEVAMRTAESDLYSTVNSLGALYAIRKEHYRPLPNNYVCDDYIPLLNTMEDKKRVKFDKTAIVYEIREKSLSDEFGRRIRVSAGGLASIWSAKSLLLPMAGFGPIPFFLWSHKVLRWFSPILMIAILIATFFLNEASFERNLFLYGQGIFYFSFLVAYMFEKVQIKFFPARVILFFVTMNYGFLLAIIKFITKDHKAQWSRDTETTNKNNK